MRGRESGGSVVYDLHHTHIVSIRHYFSMAQQAQVSFVVWVSQLLPSIHRWIVIYQSPRLSCFPLLRC